jgi:hypothetical protein
MIPEIENPALRRLVSEVEQYVKHRDDDSRLVNAFENLIDDRYLIEIDYYSVPICGDGCCHESRYLPKLYRAYCFDDECQWKKDEKLFESPVYELTEEAALQIVYDWAKNKSIDLREDNTFVEEVDY